MVHQGSVLLETVYEPRRADVAESHIYRQRPIIVR